MPDNADRLPLAANSLDEIMRRRRRQVAFRLAMMILMVVFFSRYLSLIAMSGWALVYTALQVWELLAFAKPAVGLRQTRVRCIASLATIGLNSLIFGLPAMLWSHFGGVLGMVCSAYLLSGAVLNTVLTTRGCKPAFLASITPFIAYVIGSAFIAAGARLHWDALCTVGIAGAMMSMTAITLWSDASKTQRSEAAALLTLAQREAQLEHALQRAEEASQAKSAFLANMSHELRTPLNGVLGMASVLARSDLAASQGEMVQVIATSATNLQMLLSDILDLAKIEAAQLDIHADPVAPALVVRNVAALFNAACADKGLTFELDVDPDSEQFVLADSVRLTQIVTNFCNNAIKFTETGGVTLSVRTAVKGERRIITFGVADTGIGMSVEGKARLFERFSQADGSITRRFGGTGLGLSISKQLTDLMGGKIEVVSKEGVGSIFTATFDLPAAETVQAPEGMVIQNCCRADAAEAPQPADLRVLLVEDHPVNRQVVQLILAGFADVDVAVNGAEGLQAARLNHYDVILMDMQMPVMDGVTATSAIREWEQQQGFSRTPIIMLTANAMAEHTMQSSRAGADMHLAKPITAEALLSALDAVLDAARSATVGYEVAAVAAY